MKQSMYMFVAQRYVFINCFSRTKLYELCCLAIYENKKLFNVTELKDVLPEELFSVCFGLTLNH